MREIKFRGKSTINGIWVYGYFFVNMGHYVIHNDEVTQPIHPWSVGQFTGLKDKNGKDIFESDIIKASGNGIAEIIWCDLDAMFKTKWHDAVYRRIRGESEKIFSNHEITLEVIGNIHDNPELLKQ